MAVFRVEKTKDFTIMSNHHLRNAELSLKAKGLLSLMLSLPEDWDYTTKGLAHICKDGVDSITTALKELERSGYLTRQRIRYDNGQLGDIEYTIHEKPVTTENKELSPKRENPRQVNPKQDKPKQAEPVQENPAQLNTNQSRTQKQKTNGSITYPSIYPQAPEVASPEERADGMDRIDLISAYREIVKDNIEYGILSERYGKERMDETVELMLEVMEDLLALYEQTFTEKTAMAIASLPHPTVQKFAVITVAVVGASRRFLAQITRHQNEVKFMSASLQYSNYTGQADFAVPYEILTAPEPVRDLYLESCQSDMDCYEQLCEIGIGHDAAGYATPQGLRNVLIISATPYQWKHMIGQRVCRRNTDETRIVLLKIWQELFSLSPVLFAPALTGPFCQVDKCLEGKMTCGRALSKDLTPEDILKADYPALMKGDTL